MPLIYLGWAKLWRFPFAGTGSRSTLNIKSNSICSNRYLATRMKNRIKALNHSIINIKCTHMQEHRGAVAKWSLLEAQIVLCCKLLDFHRGLGRLQFSISFKRQTKVTMAFNLAIIWFAVEMIAILSDVTSMQNITPHAFNIIFWLLRRFYFGSWHRFIVWLLHILFVFLSFTRSLASHSHNNSKTNWMSYISSSSYHHHHQLQQKKACTHQRHYSNPCSLS